MDDATWTAWHHLLFGVRRSVRYHAERRRFFDRWHRVTMLATIVGGSATIVSVAQQRPAIATALAAAVSVAGALDMVIGYAGRAREHHDLVRGFSALERDMVATLTPTGDDVARCTGRRLDLEAEEPATLRLLDSQCHNDLAYALGYDARQIVPLRWYHRLLAQYVDMAPPALPA